MKAIILAGGFAKRLWPLTKDYPKPLLKVNKKAIIEHILDKIAGVDGIDRIYISSNETFEKHFRDELKHHLEKEHIDLAIEPTTHEGDKLGAIGAIHYLIKKERIDDDVLIIAGDNLFGFDINDFVHTFRKAHKPVIAFYDIKDIDKVRNTYGNVLLDDVSRVRNFVEKPAEPLSTLISTACYIFPKSALRLLDEYMESEDKRDAPGYFISWLHKKEEVIGFVFDEHWFDIGSHESLAEAREFYAELKKR